MNVVKQCTIAILLGGILAAPLTVIGADKKENKPKPYPLDKCVVSGEKLGSMGKPYVFTHDGQEIKMCCKGCLKAFNQEPSKYLKEIEQEAKRKGK